MRHLARGWEGMTPRERIVAMSLATGGVVAIVNSTVWAIATCYIVHQRALVRLAQAQAEAQAWLATSSTTPLDDLADNEADNVADGMTMEEA